MNASYTQEVRPAAAVSLGWLTMLHLGALSLLALLAILGQLLIQRDLAVQAEDLRRVALWQQAESLVGRLSRTDPTDHSALLESLSRTIPELRPPSSSQAGEALQSRCLTALGALMDGLRRRDVGADQLSRFRELAQQMIEHFYDYTQGRLELLKLTELSLLCLMLLTLVAELVLVFRPSHRAISRLVRELEAAQNLLSRRLQALRDSHEVIKADLRAAAAVQYSLLPREVPCLPETEFAWSFKPSHNVAGDMFNVMRLDETRVGLYILDVSGHGVPAALLSVSLSRAITANLGSILKRRLSFPPYYEVVPPAQVAQELNRRFPVMSESDQFFTFLYGVLDVREWSFTYVQAGHPGPLVAHQGKITSCTIAPNPPLGILEEVEFEQARLQLEPGDVLLLYSDGLIEAQSQSGQDFGQERLERVVSVQGHQGAEATVEAVHAAVREFTQGGPQRDDLTIVGLSRAPITQAVSAPATQGLVTASGRHRSASAN